MSCAINWCAFTWEAFATLTTGLAAVGGAVWIGSRQLQLTRAQAEIADRQAGVAQRQADLLEHQVQVDRAKLRADLFERRLAVYTSCKAYMREAMAVRADFDLSFETASELGKQLEQAQFLFSGDVRERLREAADAADNLLAERETLKHLRQPDALSEPEGQAKMSAQALKVRTMQSQLRERLGSLATTMGEEMRLYIPRIDAPDRQGTT